MRLLFLYLKNKKSNIIQVVLVYVVLLLVIWLYNLPYYEAFSFGIELYGALYIVYLIYDYSVFADKIRTLERNIKTDDIQNIALPDKKNDVEALYADIIIKLHEQKRKQYDAGVLTGKPLDFWGSKIRTEATGYGLVYYVKHLLQAEKDSFEGKTVMHAGHIRLKLLLPQQS